MKKRFTQTLPNILLLVPAPAAGTSNILARFLVVLQIEEVLELISFPAEVLTCFHRGAGASRSTAVQTVPKQQTSFSMNSSYE
jgi:hypothetical protein